MNITSFLSANISIYPLLSAYGQLAALELALKDYFNVQKNQWQGGHDVPQLLADLLDSGTISLSTQLRTKISSIPCTDNKGNHSQIRPDKYPDLRYVRHKNDFFTHGVSDKELEGLVLLIKQIISAVRNLGVKI